MAATQGLQNAALRERQQAGLSDSASDVLQQRDSGGGRGATVEDADCKESGTDAAECIHHFGPGISTGFQYHGVVFPQKTLGPRFEVSRITGAK